MGYAGQASLGSGASLAVGAYASYKLATNVPQIPIVLDFFIGGVAAAAVGIVFGLPSLRMRAFYLAIATLAVATWLKMAGADIKDAQAQMRHSRATTTLDVYTQFIPESQRAVVNRLHQLAVPQTVNYP